MTHATKVPPQCKSPRDRACAPSLAALTLRAVSKDDHIEFDGVVTEVLTGGMFRVKIDDDHLVIAHLAGKMRKFRIKVVLGDRVKVAVSPYDPNRGRIIYRVR
nr:translation initiation factor IF-1 [Pseudenhygromyxa sp. WMMC2535]